MDCGRPCQGFLRYMIPYVFKWQIADSYLYCQMTYSLQPANIGDLPQLTALINSAYRGEEAKQGWTHEADLIDGVLRTDESSLIKMLEEKDSVILKYEEDEMIVGCVFLQQKHDHLYLGMLSVKPNIQARGVGKKLLAAAEDHARNLGIHKIEMTVISIRKELIAWYERRGYRDTGKTLPFHSDSKYGTPRQPVEFIVMEKQLLY
jgi:N-acetylglutamate synthase-like GNAT family acetyltransferase